MKPENRKNVARFVLETPPIEKNWIEKRLAFRWGNDIFLITDNYPRWTISQILDFLNTIGVKPFELEVEVTPIIKE